MTALSIPNSNKPQAYYVPRTIRAIELAVADSVTAPRLARDVRCSDRTARELLRKLAEEGVLRQVGHAGKPVYVPGKRLFRLVRRLDEVYGS